MRIFQEICTEDGLTELPRKELSGAFFLPGFLLLSPETAAACVAEGHALIQACGFDYVTVFRKRKPEFIKL